MKLLLHACCAPCAIYPVEKAEEDGYNDITGFFYNPNIHPSCEYERRRKEVDRLAKSAGWNLISFDYNSEDYFRNADDFEDIPKRCFSCWSIRLGKASEYARDKGYNAFTTTLLGSPYQNHEALKDICSMLSKKHNIGFYYRDFRIGFRDAHNKAKEMGVYCQRYCGCVFSLIEREETKRKQK